MKQNLTLEGGIKRLMLEPIQKELVRLNKEMTVQEIANMVGVKCNLINRAKNGAYYDIGLDSLASIADKLGINFTFYGTDVEPIEFKDIKRS